MTCALEEAERYRDEVEARILQELARSLADRFGIDCIAVADVMRGCIQRRRRIEGTEHG